MTVLRTDIEKALKISGRMQLAHDVLACSLTATLGKIKSDARKIKKKFPETTTLIFSTPEPVTNTAAQPWAKEIKEEFGYDLIVVSREDIATSLLDPSNLALCRTHLGMPVEMSASVAEQIQHLRAAAADVVAAWSHPLEGKPLIELRAVRMDDAGRDTSDIMPLADAPTALARSERIIIEAPAGRGKTTTLVQLANRYNCTEGIAILVVDSARDQRFIIKGYHPCRLSGKQRQTAWVERRRKRAAHVPLQRFEAAGSTLSTRTQTEQPNSFAKAVLQP
jgi:hypothetical protein